MWMNEEAETIQKIKDDAHDRGVKTWDMGAKKVLHAAEKANVWAV